MTGAKKGKVSDYLALFYCLFLATFISFDYFCTDNTRR